MTKTEHLLTVLSEEGAEVIHAASKAIRFGPTHIWPGKDETNVRVIERELADLIATAEILGLTIREEDKAAKREKLLKYIDYAKSLGTITG